MSDPQYEYYQPLIDARDRLKKALQGTSTAEIANKLIKYEEAEVNLKMKAPRSKLRGINPQNP